MRRSTRITATVPATKRKTIGSPRASIKSHKISGNESKSERASSPQSSDGSQVETKPESGIQKKGSENVKKESCLTDKKYQAWSAHATSSPYPNSARPTLKECEKANSTLHDMHHLEVEKEFRDSNTPETIPHVLDAMMVAVLSAATSWNSVKRAMNSMKEVYGSVFRYPEIFEGGKNKWKRQFDAEAFLSGNRKLSWKCWRTSKSVMGSGI